MVLLRTRYRYEPGGFLEYYFKCNLVRFGSGVSRISFRGGGGVPNFSGKVGVFAWLSHAFARGVRGHAPPRKFF